MSPTTRASARRAFGAPSLPPPLPTRYGQASHPPPRAASPSAGATLNLSVAHYPYQPVGGMRGTSARRAPTPSQPVAAGESALQAEAFSAPGSPILGCAKGLDIELALANQVTSTTTSAISQGATTTDQDVTMLDSLFPRAASPIFISPSFRNNFLDSTDSYSKDASLITNSDPQQDNLSQILAANVNGDPLPTVPISSQSNQAFAPRTLRSVIHSVNSTFSPISTTQTVDSPTLSVLSETTSQGDTISPKTEETNLTTSETFHKDLNDPYLRNLVGLLQYNHSWAPAKLCHSTLVSCRNYEDASDTLLKFAIELPDDEGENDNHKAQPKGKTSAQSLFGGSFDGSALPTIDSSFSSKVSWGNAPVASTSFQWKLNGQTQAGKERMVDVFAQSSQSPGIFSRAERQRTIAASKDTAADRERASFVANAVLYRAFSYQAYNDGCVAKRYTPHFNTKVFQMSSGSFPATLEKYRTSKHAYKGTDRGKFQALSFNTPEEGTLVLQSISLAFPYMKTSFEELRLGDYIRGRKKAPHLFEPFRKFPPEIRCMIWGFSMIPQTVELRHDYMAVKCWTTCKVPVCLSVCRESRYEGLKVYTLSFRMAAHPAKIYFDFKRDTLFLTFEKWHGEGDYEGGIDELTAQLVANGEAKNIRSLAMDRELVEVFANRLVEEEEEWYDEGDEDMPMPELDVIPEYTSLQSLAIVKVAIDGFWDHDKMDCDCNGLAACNILKRANKNDNAVFVTTHRSNVANKTQQEYYKQLIAKVKSQNDNWHVPELEYMMKRKQPCRDNNMAFRRTCACRNCCPDSE